MSSEKQIRKAHSRYVRNNPEHYRFMCSELGSLARKHAGSTNYYPAYRGGAVKVYEPWYVNGEDVHTKQIEEKKKARAQYYAY